MPQPGENGGGVAIRREIPLRTKKPRSGFQARTGLCLKIPKMAPKNREIRNTPAVPELRSAQSEDTMVNKVRVNIAGAPYAIATTDSETYITSLAKRLDEDIAKLEEKIEKLDREMVKNATNSVKLSELMKEKEETETTLEEKMDRWVYLNDLAEQIENQ